MSSCPSEIQWEAFVDGDLAPARSRSLASHLSACERCQALVEELLTLRATFASLADPEPPPRLVNSVMERVRREPLPEPGARLRAIALHALFTVGVVAEVAAIVLAACGVTPPDVAGMIALRWPGLFSTLVGAAGLVDALVAALGSPRGWELAAGLLRQSPWLWPGSFMVALGAVMFVRKSKHAKGAELK